MTPEDRVREFWEQRGTPLSVASITELVRAAENGALERAAALIGRKSLAGVISMRDAMAACRCLKSEPVE